LFLLSSCARLPPGRVDDLSQDAPVRICLIRGFQDWYSTGIDTLADQLRADGFDARAFGDSQWHDLAAALAASTDPQKPIILIGFSYGADDVISISRALAEKHIPIDLLITLDPVTPAAVPANVRRCVNFYESNGVWDLFPWLRGIPLHRENGDPAALENIDIRNRPDLVEPDTRHATIAANPKVHGAIIDLVKMEESRLLIAKSFKRPG
jgi:pimeloyl-ACP methyl ester carboxylesterase